MRGAVCFLLSLSIILAACGDDDSVATDAPNPEPASDARGDVGGGADEVDVRDPQARFGADVCEALLPALDGEMDGLDRYATEDVLEQLASFGPADLADTVEVGAGCEIAIGDAWATLTLEGDGHVGQRAVAIVFDSSYGGDGFDPFLEDVPTTVDRHVADGLACDGDAEVHEDLPTHEIFSTAGGYIVGIVCYRGPYQNTWQLFGWDGVDLVDLIVEQYQDGAIVESAFVVGLPSTDEDGNLTNVERARGLGDCGVRSLWFIVDATVVLDTAWARDCDDDAEPIGPDEWPVVYSLAG